MLRCLFPQAPAAGTTETCDTAGVIGGIIHVVASFQATEALKLLVGATEQLNLRMQQWDLWFNQNSAITGSRRLRSRIVPPVQIKQYDYLEAGLESDTIQSLCGRNSVQIHPVIPSIQTA